MDRRSVAVREYADLIVAAPFSSPDSSWIIGKNALLCLQVLLRNGRTEIEVATRRIPYQWLGYQYQDCDDQPFLVLHNSGGGFVQGDSAVLQIKTAASTRLLLTTSGANKFYKSDEGGFCRDLFEIDIGEEALVEYLPDEVIPYADSRSIRKTHIHIKASSRLFASDIVSSGRVNFRDGESFSFRSFWSELALRIDGRLVILDRLIAETESEVASFKGLWGGFRHLSTVLIHVPDLPEQIEDVVAQVLPEIRGSKAGVSRVGNLLCVRILSMDVWHAHEAVFKIWEATRPMVAGKPARKISKP